MDHYAKVNKFYSEPAFVCWFPYTLRRSDQIIAKVHKNYFRIEIPSKYEDSIQIDINNRNKNWQGAKIEQME